MTASRLACLSAALWMAVAAYASPRRAGDGRTGTRARAGAAQGHIEHGRYIVERVVMCAECHSTRDEQGQIVPDTRFMGGPVPVRPPWPNDWAIRAPRIAGLPGYTEELGIRLLTQGAISRTGAPLRRPMPPFHMTAQDAADVVAYLKSLP
jgi:hypothetical protein